MSDSFTSTRVCCTCSDPWHCPFNDFSTDESVYCDAECDSAECRQLAAGCGASLYAIAGQVHAPGAEGGVGGGFGADDGDGMHACDRDQVEGGACAMCRAPYWCDADGAGASSGGVNSTAFGGAAGYYDRVHTPSQWVDAFVGRDGGDVRGVRQCKWQPSQKATFLRTIRARYAHHEASAHGRWRSTWEAANSWNEVNMYIDPRNGTLARTLWDNLLGLVYIRSAGNAYELTKLRELAAHWRQLGRDVPMFAMDAEPLSGSLEYWNSKHPPVDLESPPYSLVQIF